MRNNYYELAKVNMLELKAMMQQESKYYNLKVVACYNIAEKFLKAVIQKRNPDSILLYSSNIEKIAMSIDEENQSNICDETRYLKSFISDINNPGEDYLDVNERQFMRCYEIILNLQAFTEKEMFEIDNSKINLVHKSNIELADLIGHPKCGSGKTSYLCKMLQDTEEEIESELSPVCEEEPVV